MSDDNKHSSESGEDKLRKSDKNKHTKATTNSQDKSSNLTRPAKADKNIRKNDTKDHASSKPMPPEKQTPASQEIKAATEGKASTGTGADKGKKPSSDSRTTIQSESNDTRSADRKASHKQSSKQNTVTKKSGNSPIFDDKSMPKLDPNPSGDNRQYRSGNRNKLTLILVLLLLLALSGVGWIGYQQSLSQQTLQATNAAIDDKLAQQATALQATDKALQNSLQASQSTQQSLQRQAAMIEQLNESLAATQQRLKDLSGRRQQDWMLAEAAYLIKLADFKVSLETDTRSAIALLKTADEKVKAIGDNSLIELRQSIAQDIANLQLIKSPDIGGIAVRLDALSKQIPELDIVALELSPVDKSTPETNQTTGSFDWEQLYQNFLKDFVTVKDHSAPVEPLMTLEQRGFLNANIQLALQQAQIAALRQEPALYLANLDNAIEWVGRYFKQTESAMQLLSNLRMLREETVVPELPRSLQSRDNIESINQQRLYQWLDAAVKPANNNRTSTDEEAQQ